MNCKQGEIAIKVKADPSDIIPLGAIVTCLEHRDYMVTLCGVSENVWRVDWTDGSGRLFVVPDAYLRPLRGELLEETCSAEDIAHA